MTIPSEGELLGRAYEASIADSAEIERLRDALDEANARSRRNLDLAHRWLDFERQARAERDQALAAIRRVEALCANRSMRAGDYLSPAARGAVLAALEGPLLV